MRFTLLALAAFLLLRPLAADQAQAPAPTPTPNLTPLSDPPVTPDPRFTDVNYLYKWPHIDLAETQRLMKKKGTVLADGRSMLEWEQSHLPGAVPLPLGDFDKNYGANEEKLKKAKIIIAYCHGEGCHLSDALCQNLVNKGFSNVAVFWGGYPAWSTARLPMQDKFGRPYVYPTPVPK
jgi:rhodanese-related sulfurtransferase